MRPRANSSSRLARRRIGRLAFSERNGAIREAGFCAISASEPCAMTYPPFAPACGPISIIQSAWERICVSWSTRMTEFPSAIRSRMTPIKPDDVCRMQTDGRFIQHIKHAGRPVADGAGKLHALAFAGGERGGRSGRGSGSQAPDPSAERRHFGNESQMLFAIGCISFGRLSGTPATHCTKSDQRHAGRLHPAICRAVWGRVPPRSGGVPPQSGQTSCLQKFFHALHALFVLDLGERVFDGIRRRCNR